MTLRKYMKDNNLTYGKVSKDTGIDRKALWLYWTGDKSITLEMAKRLSEAYGGTVWYWWEEGAKSLVQDNIDVGERDRNIPPMFFEPNSLARIRDEVVVVDDFGIDMETGEVEWYVLTDGRVVDAWELKGYESREITEYEVGDIVKASHGFPEDVINLEHEHTYEILDIDPYEGVYNLKLKCVDTGKVVYEADCHVEHEDLAMRFGDKVILKDDSRVWTCVGEMQIQYYPQMENRFVSKEEIEHTEGVSGVDFYRVPVFGFKAIIKDEGEVWVREMVFNTADNPGWEVHYTDNDGKLAHLDTGETACFMEKMFYVG